MDNHEKHCQACENLSEVLTDQQIEAALSDLSDWRYDPDNRNIHKRFTFKNYGRTMAFVNLLAWSAQRENHHPDCRFGYNYCEVSFQTHSLGGVSENDIIAVRQLERLLS
jgi:4a-hydroxytetrahydrobiopterin dehydratase